MAYNKLHHRSSLSTVIIYFMHCQARGRLYHLHIYYEFYQQPNLNVVVLFQNNDFLLRAMSLFQRVFCNRGNYPLSFLRLSQLRKLSESSSKTNDSNLLNEESVRNQLEQNSIGEEMPSGSEEVKRLLRDAATFSDAADKSWATTPYPAGAPTHPDEEQKRPKTDPKEKSIILFPGQGTLKVGIAKKYLKFPEAKELFEIANEILGYDLLKLCLKGPQEKLDQTQFNQPATVVTSLAALEQLREERPQTFLNTVGVAGYSVGELTALIFSGVISFEDGIRLVAVRGSAMQYASSLSPQGMLSVYCTPAAQVSQACKDAQKWAEDLGVKNPVCSIAIYLYTQAKILAGSNEALDFIEKNSEKYGLIRLTRLPVSGAFHTQLMEPALKSFHKMLGNIEIDEPRTTVYSNATGLPYYNSHVVKKYLMKQIVRPVKWEQCIQGLCSRPVGTPFPKAFDVGSGGRMKIILRKINAKAYDNCIAV